jgi:hypothetical protein
VQVVCETWYLDMDSGESHRNPGWASIDWSVEPSDGASVSRKGLFTATKPGVYTVAAETRAGMRNGRETVRIYVSEEQVNTTVTKPATTETEPPATTETTTATTETESTNTSETTATTETAATSFAGTYKGIAPWNVGSEQRDVPFKFTVDADGNV